MRSFQGPNLPYAVVAGVVPTASGWLIASAKLRGATFAPEEPRLTGSFRDVLDVRPPISIVVVSVPIGCSDESNLNQRSCDREARALLGERSLAMAPSSMRASLPGGIDSDDSAHFDEEDFHLERLREVAREMSPSSQRVIHEGYPGLSFYQLNGFQVLRWPSNSDDGHDERRAMLELKVPGVTRILDAKLPGIVPSEFIDVAALLWTARRVYGHSAARLPSEGEWDSRGLRMELVM